MPIYRATVWLLPVTVGDIEGYAGLTRRVIESNCHDRTCFKGEMTDLLTRHVDDSIWFGPISEKKKKNDLPTL